MNKITFPAPGSDWGTIDFGESIAQDTAPSFHAADLTITIEDKPLPIGKKAMQQSHAWQRALKEHKQAYMAVFIRQPRYIFMGQLVSIDGGGLFGIKRIRELTEQLKFRRQSEG